MRRTKSFLKRGLSPCGGEERQVGRTCEQYQGFIPPRAGEGLALFPHMTVFEVYPRARGGELYGWDRSRGHGGLSPRAWGRGGRPPALRFRLLRRFRSPVGPVRPGLRAGLGSRSFFDGDSGLPQDDVRRKFSIAFSLGLIFLAQVGEQAWRCSESGRPSLFPKVIQGSPRFGGYVLRRWQPSHLTRIMRVFR